MVGRRSSAKHLTFIAALIVSSAQEYNSVGSQRTSTVNCEDLSEDCQVEVDACREDAACHECLIRVSDRYEICEAGIEFSTLECGDGQVQEFTCCSFEGGDNCGNDALLRAFYGMFLRLSISDFGALPGVLSLAFVICIGTEL